MTPEQAAAYVMAQAACVMAEVAAMQADNAEYSRRGLDPPHAMSDFTHLIDQYAISHNAVRELFQVSHG